MAKSNGDGLGYSYHLPSGGWNLRLKNSLSQFCELFSEFDKFIAPAYHHDRCERSVQMRLYTMHKREFMVTLSAFLMSVSLAIFIGATGPPISSTSELDGKLLLQNNNQSDRFQELIASGPFTMRTPALSPYSQQLWVIVKLVTGNTDDEIYDKTFQVSTTIEGLTAEHKPVSLVGTEHSPNRTRHLRCENQECDEFIVMHLGYIRYTHYMLTVRFHGLEAFHKRYNINHVTFYFKTYHPGFTKIEVCFRFFFLVTTFIVAIIFLKAIRKYPYHDYSLEQKWMSWLLPCLMAFNNPIFPWMFMTDSWIPGLVDAIAQASFICALLLFWLCIYHGLRQNERKFLTFYVPKLFVVSMLWIPAVILAVWEKVEEMDDPTYNHEIDTSNFYVIQSFFCIFSLVYMFYLVVLILKAYTDLRSMPIFNLRLKYSTLLMVIVFLAAMVITFSRFGVGFLEDSFVARLSTHYSNSAQFMALYGLLNFYIYTMAYLYSPGNSSDHEFAITKDNPAFSMINDSDEDVIYGSDEESRRPLNRSRNDDDSD